MNQEVTEKAVIIRDIYVSFAFDMESKLLVCVSETTHEDSSPPPTSHSVSCSAMPQNQSRCYSEHTPGASQR